LAELLSAAAALAEAFPGSGEPLSAPAGGMLAAASGAAVVATVVVVEAPGAGLVLSGGAVAEVDVDTDTGGGIVVVVEALGTVGWSVVVSLAARATTWARWGTYPWWDGGAAVRAWNATALAPISATALTAPAPATALPPPAGLNRRTRAIAS
jgi:hypothetical protein